MGENMTDATEPSRAALAGINFASNALCAGLMFGATRIGNKFIKFPALAGTIALGGLLNNWKDKHEFTDLTWQPIASGAFKHTLDLAFFSLAAAGLRRWSQAGILARSGIVLGTAITSLYGLIRLIDSTTATAFVFQNVDNDAGEVFDPMTEIVSNGFEHSILGFKRW
jgi:hypothetical protein